MDEVELRSAKARRGAVNDRAVAGQPSIFMRDGLYAGWAASGGGGSYAAWELLSRVRVLRLEEWF